MQSGSPEASTLPAPLADLESFKDSRAIEGAQKTIDQINVILSRPEYVEISKAFDKCARDAVKADKAWHVPLGKPSLAALIADIGKSAEYMVFYAAGSEVTHSSNYAQHVHFGKGTVTLDAIRQLPGFESLFRFSCAVALRSYRIILAEYRSGELPRFAQKYVENWQKAFLEVPKVKFDVKKTGPASHES